MGDLDFEELDKAISELYESLDDDFNNDADGNNDSGDAAYSNKDRSAGNSEGQDIVDNNTAVPAQQDDETNDMASKSADQAGGNRKNQVSGGHFMDMIHPSSDTQVQHKHNFAPERQAELDEKRAEEADEIDDSVGDGRAAKLSRITISVDDASEQNSDDADLPKPTEQEMSDGQAAMASADAKEPAVIEVTSDDDMTMSSRTDDGVVDAKDTPDEKEEQKLPLQQPSSGRRGVRYSNANRRSKHDLAQPMPAVAATTAAAAEATTAMAKEPYEVPFLPDAKVTKRPLGGAPSTKSEHRKVADQHSSLGDKSSSESMSVHGADYERQSVEHSNDKEGEPTERSNRRGDAGRHSVNRRKSSVDNQPVATRRSVTSTNNELTVRSGKDKALRIIGRILLFVAIIIIGVLTGMAFYYYGG